MLSFAYTVTRATRFFLAGSAEPALWTISVRGRVVGSLMCEAGAWRLAWFEGADRRLVAYAGPVDGDVDALERVLAIRIGVPVHLESLPV
jgi:hypothetical protein